LMAQPAASHGVPAAVSPLQREESLIGVLQPGSVSYLEIFDIVVRPPPAL